MLVRNAFVAVALLVSATAAPAAMSRSVLVPVYKACPGSGNCTPPVLASSYTFDSIYLYSSSKPYTAPGQFALMVVVKGLKDAGGNPFTGKLVLSTGTSRITILSQSVGTLGETSLLALQPPYVVDVKNGNARARFNTPDNTPKTGLIVNSLTAPILYDPDGNELASTGTQSKPAGK